MDLETLKKEAIKITLMSEEEEDQNVGMKFYRIMISKPTLDIKEALDLGLLPRIIELMKKHNDDAFLMDAAWSLTNIASATTSIGSQAIIKEKGLEVLRSVFDRSESVIVKGQCLWAFSNVTQDSEKNRDIVMNLGIFSRTLDFFHQLSNDNFDQLQIALWTLGSLNNSKYKPLLTSYISSSLEIFMQHFNAKNEIVKLEALKGINTISEQRNFAIKIVKIVPELIELVDSTHEDMRKEALRIIGNIAYSNETRHLLNFNIIPSFMKWLKTDDEHLLKECTWIISNIAADGFIDDLHAANIFPRIIELISHDNEKIRREAVWVINNATKNGSFDVCKQLVVWEIIRDLKKCLDENENHEILLTTCETIFHILQAGQRYFADVNLFSILVDKYGGLILRY